MAHVELVSNHTVCEVGVHWQCLAPSQTNNNHFDT